MDIGIIGAGKVGFTLGKYFTEHGIVVAGYYSKTPSHSREAAEFTGTRAYESAPELLKDSDALILSVPDGAIKKVYLELPPELIKGKIICHCSGSVSSDEAFRGIAKAGGYGLSIHPLFPVSDRYKSHLELEGAFFCVEGDEYAAGVIIPLLKKCGNNVQNIDKTKKTLYHRGCVTASNLVIALAAYAVDCLKNCGFTEENALEALAPLMRSNLEHIIADGTVSALTGPVERNDIETVNKHLSFSNYGDIAYRQLSLKLADIASAKHPDTDYGPMIRLLRGGSIKE